MSNLNYRVKRIENKMNRASGSCEIRLKVLIFVSQKKRIMSVVQKKIFEEIMVENFLNLAKEISLKFKMLSKP